MLPLDGVRILDMGQFWAGPNAGRAWADAGAEVIKVESCARPDPLRLQPRGIYPDHEPGEDPWNRSGMVNERNRNKLGLAIDLQHPKGKQVFLSLVHISDAVSHNFSTRVMPSLGLDYESLKSVNPRIIMVSLMSQGLDGPESDYVSFGPNLEQLGGISYFSGYPDEPGSSVGFALPDPLGGAAAALGLIAALRYRDLTGEGVQLDISQREAASLVVGRELVEYSLTGALPPRLGNHDIGAVPSECYPTAGDDQWVAIAVENDAEWAGVCRAIDRVDLIFDPRFATVLGRSRNRGELDALIGAWTSSRDKLHVMQVLQSWGVTATAVLNPRELFREPHLRMRGFWEAVDDRSAGRQEYYGRPYRFSGTLIGTRTPTPRLGEHNHYILNTLLGMSEADIADLEREGVVGTEPLAARKRRD
jgi:crotonobetainyl-CoA:carnitine CoA-transferase CaiB-like acyl-CoA transferase